MTDSDHVSGLARILTVSLGGKYPIRLALGISVGLAVKIGIHTVSRANPEISTFSALNEFSAAWFLLVFVPLFFIPIIWGRQGAPEDVVQEINTIEAVLNRGRYSSAQRALIWHSLLQRYVQAARPQLGTRSSMQELFEEIEKKIGPGATP